MKLRFLLGASMVAMVAHGIPSESASAQGAVDDSGVLEEIIVTAQKRAQNIQDVPISITNMSGERLDVASSAGMDVRFLSARVPSLMVESSFGRTFPRFYIRGLGNTDFDLNASQPVSLIYDDVVLENPILKGFPVFDVERIEVLRGPQGTLFGRNTPAGIVKFESRKPTDTLEAYATLSAGRFANVDFEGAISGPLSDTVSVRGSVLYQRRDDWVDNEHANIADALEGYDEKAARFQVAVTPSENLRMNMNLHARELNGTARVFRANIIKAGGGGLIDGFDRKKVWHDATNNVQDISNKGAVANASYDFGDNFTATVIASYESVEMFSRGDIDGGYGAVFLPDSGPGLISFSAESADAIPYLDQYTVEARIASNDFDPINFQLGAFYFKEKLKINSYSYDTLFPVGAVNCPGAGMNGCGSQDQRTKAYAFFGSAEVDVSETTLLEAGIRVSNDEKTMTVERMASNLAFLGVVPLAPTTVSTDDSQVSWNVSLTHEASDDMNIYGRVARGFRAPSIQGRVVFAFDLGGPYDGLPPGLSVADTETITSFEAGFKSDIAGGRGRLNMAAFYYNMNDQQLTAVGGAFNVNTLINADKTTGWGIEMDMEMAASENFFWTAGVSYNHTKINDDDLAIAPCGGGCTVLDPAGPVAGTVLIGGNALPHAPRFIANVTARYSVPYGDAGEFFIFTDWAYRSKINFFLYESAEFQDNSLLEGGLRIGYARNDGSMEVAGFIRNILDDTSLTGGIDFNNLTGFVNEPRVWGVELTRRF